MKTVFVWFYVFTKNKNISNWHYPSLVSISTCLRFQLLSACLHFLSKCLFWEILEYFSKDR